MKIFMESLDKGIWDAIENCPFIPKFEKFVKTLFKQFTHNFFPRFFASKK